MTIAGSREAHGSDLLVRTAANLRSWLGAALGSGRVRPGQLRPAWGRPAHLLLGAAMALALVAAAILFLDRPALEWPRELPSWLVRAFAVVTEFGRSGWVLIPCAILLLAAAAAAATALRRVPRLVLASFAARVGYVFAAVAVPGLLVAVGKRLIGRARPRALEVGDSLGFRFFGWDSAYASLPSGHSTTAFAAAFALGALFPRWRPVWWSCAALIAFSRVAVGAHHPSDVIAGAVIGVVGALVVRNWFAVRRLAFTVAPDRSVRRMAGPSRSRLRAAFAAGALAR